MIVPGTSSPDVFSLAWFDEIAPLIQAAVVVVTGTVAVLGVTAWRKQLVGKRRAELAEQVLTSFYEVKDVFAWVRTRGFLGHEGESRKAVEEEPEQVRMMRNTYFIPIERIHAEKELFSRLHAQRYAFRAFFGKEADGPFKTIAEAQNKIRVAAGILIQMAQFDGANAGVATARDNLLDDLGWGKRERPDDLDRSIDKAIADIEQICRPILEGKAA